MLTSLSPLWAALTLWCTCSLHPRILHLVSFTSGSQPSFCSSPVFQRAKGVYWRWPSQCLPKDQYLIHSLTDLEWCLGLMQTPKTGYHSQHTSITVSSPKPNTDQGHLRTNNLCSPETLRVTPCTWKIHFVVIVSVLLLVPRLEPRAPDMLRKYFATGPHPMLNSEKNIFNSQALLLKPPYQHYSTKPGHTNCLWKGWLVQMPALHAVKNSQQMGNSAF